MTRVFSRLRDRAKNGFNGNGNGHRGPRFLGPPVRVDARRRYVVTAAESAPCTCPDFCERDHGAE
jgi:hypothetical protein